MVRAYLFSFVIVFTIFVTEMVHGKPHNATEIEPRAVPTPPIGTKCGGTINSYSGRLSYKPFSMINPNERCVWIIRYPGATSVQISDLNLGIPNSLTFTSLGHRDKRTDWIPTSQQSTLMDYTNVLIVTLAAPSTSVQSRGFEFSFAFGTTGSNLKASGTSEDVLVATDFAVINYPSSNRSSFPELPHYGNNDLSVFVFVPPHTKSNCTTEINVIYREIYVEPEADYLDVLTFNETTGKYSQLGSIVGEESSEHISWNDVIMLVFRSDENVVRYGFHLTSMTRDLCS